MRFALFSFVSSLILLFSSPTLANSDYYYAKTYFSKAAAPKLSCPPGANTVKKSGGIICQKKCESGFTQIGNWCEPNRSKRKVKESVLACQKTKKVLGVKSCTKRGYECRDGFEGPKKMGGIVPMCLSPCPENFRGASIAGVPHCVNSKGKYSVISLKTNLTCNKGFELNAAGACIEKCRKNYSNVLGTNICAMSSAPAGYSFCSLRGHKSPGFSRAYDVGYGKAKVRIPAKMACEIMSASQIYTVQSLLAATHNYACPACLAEREANKAKLLATYSEDIPEVKKIGGEILEHLTPLQKKLLEVIEEGGSIKNVDMVKLTNVARLHFLMEGVKFTAKTTTRLPAFYKIATSRDPNSYEGRLEIIRNAATIASLFLAIPSVISSKVYPGIDLLGASMDTIATFAYPVWDKR